MATVQLPPAMQPNNLQNAEANRANDDPVTPITLFLRYLYTGSTSASIPAKSTKVRDLSTIDNTLACVMNMANAQPNLPVATIRKVYDSKMYVSVDECLIALAFCAKQGHSEELRTLANSAAITMITNQADFLLFVHYYMKVSEVLRAGHKSFGHGMCRVVEKWYEKYSPIELANMFGEHRGLHGLTHQSVIKRAHMRTKKRNNTEDGAATAAATVEPMETNANATASVASAPTPSTSSASSVNVGASTSTDNGNNVTTTSNAQPAAATSSSSSPSQLSAEDDREQVFQFVFCNGSQEYLKYLNEKAELGVAAERLKALQILKTNENIENAAKSIQRHKFTIDQMPAHLLEQQKIWDVLLPTLSTRSLLHHFHTMKDHGFLNDDAPFAQKFLEVFGRTETFKTETICPINVFIQRALYMENMRYVNHKKAEYYKKKMQKRNVTTNPLIVKRLDEMFEQTLQNAKPIPAKFLIVMDLRRGNAKKPILRNAQITCFDAAFLLAYSIFTREKDTLVYSFTDKADKLHPLHTIMPKNNYKMAKEAIGLETVARTYQSLAKPIAEATAAKKKVDMFVVIVDSVARFCRQGQVPVQEFKEYRKKFNDRAKYVVINMTRPSPDLKIPETDAMKGFFEICGFNQDTPKILNALANHCFT